MVPLRFACAYGMAAAPLASWRPGLVLLSYAVAVAASFTALDVATRIAVNTGLARRVWLVSGAVMMGIGIWSMHFVGMLAFQVDIPMSYDGPTTLASMVVAIVASGFALVVASKPDVTIRRIVIGGLWLGLAINAMHYIGMAAMRMPARVHYDPLVFAVSVLIGVVASIAALFLAFRLRAEAFHHTWSRRKLLGAVVLASAIAGMHYTGMAAVEFDLLADGAASNAESGMQVSELGATAIGFATLLGLGLTLVGSLVDLERRRSQRLFELLAEASSRMGRSLEPNLILDGFVSVLVPERAPFCFVELKEDDPRLLRVRSVARVGRAFVEPHGLLRNRLRSADERDLVDRVIRTGRALTISALTPDQLVEVAGDGEIRRALARAGVRSCLAVPVHIRGEVLGAVVALACEPRRFGPADVALFEDLAGRLAHALENARLYHEAQEAIRVRDEFLTIASHELNTPLTPLQLHLQTLKNTVASSPEGMIPVEVVVPKVEMAERQQKRLARLVSELLDISRIRLGRLQLNTEEYDLSASSLDVVERLRPELERAGSRVSVHVPAAVIGRWDRSRIEQVLANLLSNAAKYGAGKPIDVAVVEDTGSARITVRDHGIGIPPDQQERIFERFERAASPNFGGLGLGLYIARQIIEAHGGTIRVKSSLGAGSTFVVDLPLPEAN